MYGSDGWEFKELDTQPSKSFSNIGIDGCSTVRFAADFGEYFSRYGFIIYDKDKDGELNNTTNPLSDYNLKPGDLVFWSKKVNDRFKSITHIGIVAENTSRYFHVTGQDGKGTLDERIVVFYPEFDDGATGDSESNYDDDNHPLNTLVLICRPDYRPRTKKEETPIGVNLLGYPWSNGLGASFTGAGLSFKVEDIHTLIVSGTGNDNSFRLKGTTDTSRNDHIKLSPGTYELSGIDSK